MAPDVQILVIDDDPAIRKLLRRELAAAGYGVDEAEPGRAALRRIGRRQVDLLMLNIDGLSYGGDQAIQEVREFSAVPIVALSARDDEVTAVTALQAGADDVVRNPFSTRELLARVENALRRQAREVGRLSKLVTGDLEIDLLHRRVRSQGREVRLSAKPYAVLRILAEKVGEVVTHEEILREVWGASHTDRVPYLRVAIRELRRKLEVDPTEPRHIHTENRVGYRLEMHKRRTQGDDFTATSAHSR